MTDQSITTFRPSEYLAFSRMPGAIPELDGLRAIAVLLVLGRHAVWPLYQESGYLFPVGSWDVAVPFLNGWIGVDLFFVLSGFLITYHILRRSKANPLTRFGQYLGARALRIVPCYLAVLALAIAGSIPLYHIAPEHLTFRIAYHLLFLQDYLPSNIVVPFWSLGVEEKFYLLAPFLVLMAIRTDGKRRRAVFLAGLVLLPAVLRTVTAFQHSEVVDYYWFFRIFRSPFHVSFDGLAVGVLCAFIYNDRSQSGVPKRYSWPKLLFWLSTIALVLQLFVWELLSEIGWYQKTVQPLLLSLTFGGLLISVVSGPSKGLLLRSHILMIVARISYPLYLIHITFVPVALALTTFIVGEGPLDFLRYLLVYLVMSFIFAFILHFSVEKPFLLLKDQLWKPRSERLGRELMAETATSVREQ